jgi:protein-tyrosine phosphatase
VVGSYALSISPGNYQTDINKLIDEDNYQKMIDMNVLMVADSLVVPHYKEFFALLQNPDKLPLLFHCSAGKDRTGMGAALLLYALGVDDSTIMNDYLASNAYLTNKYAGALAKYPTLQPLYEVKPEYLGAGLERIRADHGSIDNYLVGMLKADTAALRRMYLVR